MNHAAFDVVPRDPQAETLAAYAIRYLDLRIAEVRRQRAELTEAITLLEREKQDIQREWGFDAVATK